ncbi:ribonuclease III [Oleidesulfovibrio alaskensis G20]|jgi:ribonuclease-3|uniref:Ribonuclease 3 n=1 Tax=Oleidesulfovibrio alaskensis (strain ATCC BAA-1058 / DSM 17464 / G20) TaxID=207559 RepID=RNC_OLEA2|nr:ribonuclease III [Oleidesulfovibrio alaskensis]Q310Z1.1 RecName: Full=Ribonuclease 3; AltName: Full=Ribonuclease III; Short=RNase III [Oleidesulfovibrio alaskensis G20]MBL3587994.1 ribonuclease III [bacterium]ABB38505.1 ribonuclease III [Oleidesulfovibrio alaskensis G20]MBG0773484.1 ribonuclease III [Oleidesulfovibrio alaskensis]MBL3580923.1 ribonuclease III [Oleidesulfovibrio alaskensis]
MFEKLQDVLCYRFADVRLLETALTHSSYANERGTEIEHNERLEYLGDAVLELTVSEQLFTRFPEAREGQLTRMRARLVSKPSLAELARELKLDTYLLLGKGEESQGGRTRSSVLSDAFEAILGAIFLDGGYAAAGKTVLHVFSSRWPQGAEAARTKDAKSTLQELTQRLFKERPVYTLLGSSGPEHEKIFKVRLLLPDGRALETEGQSVKRAEQKAAGLALELLEGESA